MGTRPAGWLAHISRTLPDLDSLPWGFSITDGRTRMHVTGWMTWVLVDTPGKAGQAGQKGMEGKGPKHSSLAERDISSPRLTAMYSGVLVEWRR